LLAQRHRSIINPSKTPFLGSIGNNHPEYTFSSWPFETDIFLPDFMSGRENIWLTVDNDGTLWLANHFDLYQYRNGKFHDVRLDGKWPTEHASPSESAVLGFGTEVLYYQPGKFSYSPVAFLGDTDLYYKTIYYTVDTQTRTWFYLPEKGLVTIEKGIVQFLGKIPGDLTYATTGGVFLHTDGKIWVGSSGSIWELDHGVWTKKIIPDTEQVFTHFAQDNQGNLYGATNEGVYQFNRDGYSGNQFVSQGQKPYIALLSKDSETCEFNKRYIVFENCFGYPPVSSEYDYKTVLLNVQSDGSVIYVNNHVVAKYKDGEWRSFLFDTFSIASAASDWQGNLWLYSISDGLFVLRSSIFEDYRNAVLPFQ